MAPIRTHQVLSLSQHRSFRNFWNQATALNGSVTPYVFKQVLSFGLFAALVSLLEPYLEKRFGVKFALEVNPFEIAGAVLGLLLVFRTNAGYDRWYEARKLWGGIVNQSRNLAIAGLSYGPGNSDWRREFVTWIAVFPHIARLSLRSEAPDEKVIALIGEDAARHIENSGHMPSFVTFKLGQLLQEALDHHELDHFVFLQIDTQRAQLIDHIGGCERILKTPLPLAFAIKIRRFIVMFLVALPIALAHQVNREWLIPLITMAVAYPLLSLDQIGVELQNPFLKRNLNHLPLGDISDTIEKNVLGLLNADDATLRQEVTRDMAL